MNDEQTAFLLNPRMVLEATRLPYQLNSSCAAALLGFQPHDIPRLVAADLLTPLGKPTQASTKHFLTAELEQLRANRRWFSRARQIVYFRSTGDDRQLIVRSNNPFRSRDRNS